MYSSRVSTPKKCDPGEGTEMKGIAQTGSESRMNNTSFTLLHGMANLFLILFVPAICEIWWIALESYDCSISEALYDIWANPAVLFRCYQPPRLQVVLTFLAWIAFQAILSIALPGKVCLGQPTPAGECLPYKLNGFGCWVTTVLVALGFWVTDIIDMSFIATHWCDFLSVSAYYGWALALLVFLKAHLAPSHAMDRRFSGNLFTDFYNGIELNPRIGKTWDLKLFHNGHCAMIAWTVIDLSFIALQYQKFGVITNSMIIVTFIRAIVSVDILWNEQWYLRTLDIVEEPFGFYFTFGSGFFIHFMYTLQSQYLVRYPVSLSYSASIFVLLLGGTGYAVNFIANDQKNIVRDTRGKRKVWTSGETSIKVQFVTKDGVTQETFLACSGLWGIVRHPNYVGTIFMTLAMGAACGFECILPWTECFFAIPFIAQRSLRDEAKCARKYGQGWKLYREKVKWNLIPGVF